MIEQRVSEYKVCCQNVKEQEAQVRTWSRAGVRVAQALQEPEAAAKCYSDCEECMNIFRG